MCKVLRALSMLACSLLTLLAGCKTPGGIGVYGVPAPQRDPTVTIAGFSYSPDTIRVGDKLVFEVTLNKPINFGWLVTAKIGSDANPVANAPSTGLYIALNDLGGSPDAVANDGIFTGEYIWPIEYGPQNSLPVAAELWDLRAAGPPLTVLPAAEE